MRAARPAEARLCRMLLGDTAPTHPDYHLFLAVDESCKLLGAGSLRSGFEEMGEFWSAHVNAIPAFRGSGVEAKLLEYARSYAAAHGARILQTMRWFEQGSEEERYWRSLGFVPHQARYAHETDVEQAYARWAPLYQQVRDHGWIPANARTIPLAEADLNRVCEIHLQYLGGSVRQLLPLLDGTAPNAFDRDASVVLLCDEQTMGFTLGWFPEPTVCEVIANVLHPSVRFGWANVLLKFDALLRVMERQAKVLRYVTMEKHTDTRRTGKWVGGWTTRLEVCLQSPCIPAGDANGQPSRRGS